MGCEQSSESFEPRILPAEISPEVQESNHPSQREIKEAEPADGEVDQTQLNMLIEAQNL